ncbi:Uncharacterised protein [Rothia kristinae]|nr:Uncharacterised protein [Rothia kristinae]
MPASLENSPRRTPCMITPITPPVTNSRIPKAPAKICAITCGTSPRFMTTTISPSRMYRIAMTGTRIWVTAEMERTPPKMISAVIAVRMIPRMTFRAVEEANSGATPFRDSDTASAMELDWTMLNTKP